MKNFFIPFIILVLALFIASAYNSLKEHSLKPNPSPSIIEIQSSATPSASLVASSVPFRSQPSIIQSPPQQNPPQNTVININQSQQAGQSATPAEPSPESQHSSNPSPSSNIICNIVPGLPVVCQ